LRKAFGILRAWDWNTWHYGL